MLDSLSSLNKAEFCWIPCPYYPRKTCLITCSFAFAGLLFLINQGRLLLDSLSLLTKRLLLDSLSLLTKAVFCWIPCPQYLRKSCLFTCPYYRKETCWIPCSHNPRQTIWIPCPRYPRKTYAGFLVLITQGRYSLDSLSTIL